MILKKQITIKEIAKIAETSVSTVAKSLKDSNEISIATKKKILDLAHKYNYRPNQGRSLVKQNKVIGILFGNSNILC